MCRVKFFTALTAFFLAHILCFENIKAVASCDPRQLDPKQTTDQLLELARKSKDPQVVVIVALVRASKINPILNTLRNSEPEPEVVAVSRDTFDLPDQGGAYFLVKARGGASAFVSFAKNPEVVLQRWESFGINPAPAPELNIGDLSSKVWLDLTFGPVSLVEARLLEIETLPNLKVDTHGFRYSAYSADLKARVNLTVGQIEDLRKLKSLVSIKVSPSEKDLISDVEEDVRNLGGNPISQIDWIQRILELASDMRANYLTQSFGEQSVPQNWQSHFEINKRLVLAEYGPAGFNRFEELPFELQYEAVRQWIDSGIASIGLNSDRSETLQNTLNRELETTQAQSKKKTVHLGQSNIFGIFIRKLSDSIAATAASPSEKPALIAERLLMRFYTTPTGEPFSIQQFELRFKSPLEQLQIIWGAVAGLGRSQSQPDYHWLPLMKKVASEVSHSIYFVPQAR